MNKVILIGRLTKDPELRTTGTGTSVATFTLAVNRPFTDQSGERTADFINCVVWRKQAENMSRYTSKGSQVAVEGRIQTRSYDAQDGSKRYVTEIICDNVSFLSSNRDNSNSSNSFGGNTNDFGNMNQDIVTTDVSEDPFKDFGEEISLSDDDLPF
ncbi:MAG: single-stranded DNA-binding protein [Bacilli bacterium]|nr:single-stranded DNA-binding protein [Bacilli bacterium]